MAFLYERAGRLTAKNGGFRPGQVMDLHSGVSDPSHVQGTSFEDYTAARRLLNVRYTEVPRRRLEGGSCTAVTFDLHAPLNGPLRRGPSVIIPFLILVYMENNRMNSKLNRIMTERPRPNTGRAPSDPAHAEGVHR